MPAVDEYYAENKSRIKSGFTIGRAVNISIAINFLCILISSVVAVGTLAHLQDEV